MIEGHLADLRRVEKAWQRNEPVHLCLYTQQGVAYSNQVFTCENLNAHLLSQTLNALITHYETELKKLA